MWYASSVILAHTMLYFQWQKTKLNMKDWHGMDISWFSPCTKGLPQLQCAVILPQQMPHIRWWTSCLQRIVPMNTWRQADRAQKSLLVHPQQQVVHCSCKATLYYNIRASCESKHVTYIIKYFPAHVASCDRRTQLIKSNSKHNTWL